MHPPVQFFQRTFPSANIVLLRGEHPILVDSGFGSDLADTITWLQDTGTAPGSLQMVVNTHYHCDHSGGNHGLQSTYDLSIGAHHWDAAIINGRDTDACSAAWLGQPVEQYTVTHPLHAGDILDTGDAQWQVLHTPGHTLGHISLYCDGVLIAGDTVHADDIAWLTDYREGIGAAYRMLETLDALATLPLDTSYSGHGAMTTTPLKRIDAARRRYERWLRTPQKIGWHAMKRIFTYELMLADGLNLDEIRRFLLSAAWFDDYTTHLFNTTPDDFIQPLLDEIERSGAGIWRDGILYPAAPYTPPHPGWRESIPAPTQWSAPRASSA